MFRPLLLAAAALLIASCSSSPSDNSAQKGCLYGPEESRLCALISGEGSESENCERYPNSVEVEECPAPAAGSCTLPNYDDNPMTISLYYYNPEMAFLCEGLDEVETDESDEIDLQEGEEEPVDEQDGESDNHNLDDSGENDDTPLSN